MNIDPDCNNDATMWTIGSNNSMRNASKLAHLTNLVLNNEVQVQQSPVSHEATDIENVSKQNEEYVNDQDEEFESDTKKSSFASHRNRRVSSYYQRINL
jgi:hypothetical protein